MSSPQTGSSNCNAMPVSSSLHQKRRRIEQAYFLSFEAGFEFVKGRIR